MSCVLIIGAGGVGGVATQKCAQRREIFSRIVLASRTIEKCERIATRTAGAVEIDRVDASDAAQIAALIRKHRPEMVIHVALPYQNLAIMEACLETGVMYLDTACYEPPNEARYSHTWQWAYDEPFRRRGVMAVLGCGFDPGVTNIYIAHALKNHFDEIHAVDILDCNAGRHAYPFATNFNPEINIREVTAPGRYYENGQWVETAPLSMDMIFDFPEIGPRRVYLMYHEELESLVKHIPHLRRIRFWMTFSDEYLTHLRCLQNIGITRINPVKYEGMEIVPLKFLKALLPDPAELARTYSGKTCIGCLIEGIKNGERRRYFIYNVCDHEESFREVGASAVSYTAGVPPVLGAELMLKGIWSKAGVFNVEQLDPSPFMERIGPYGLPWKEIFFD